MEARGTHTLYGSGVALCNLGVPGGRQDNTASMYSSCGTSLLIISIHSRKISTEAGIWIIRMSLVKAMTFPSSGIGLKKDGLTNWVPQRTLVCSSGNYRNTITGGLPPKGKVTTLSSIIWGVVSCWASRRENMPRKPSSVGSGTVATTPATVSLIEEGFYVGWRAWGVGLGRGGY